MVRLLTPAALASCPMLTRPDVSSTTFAAILVSPRCYAQCPAQQRYGLLHGRRPRYGTVKPWCPVTLGNLRRSPRTPVPRPTPLTWPRYITHSSLPTTN